MTTAGDRLKKARELWVRARGIEGRAATIRTGLTYHRAFRCFLRYVGTVRRDPHSYPTEATAACYALSVLGQEAVPALLASGARYFAAIDARTALAAAYLADPSGGRPDRVGAVFGGPELDRLNLDGVVGVTPSERMASAAYARMLVARLIVDHPRPRGWRSRRAVLPTCAGLTPREEALQLGRESVDLFAALARAIPALDAEYRRLRREYETLVRDLLTAPRRG